MTNPRTALQTQIATNSKPHSKMFTVMNLTNHNELFNFMSITAANMKKNVKANTFNIRKG